LIAGYLPFHDENIVQMYKKVYKGDFTCPNWFSPEARELVTRMLDPNAETRISVAEILESRWMMNGGEGEAISELEDYNNDKFFGKKESEALNAFHIISMSE
ncbi:hypothetical protein, partial [Ligilactobacillus salivarius]|uniref:hypothetical protein n=1 Tax=Ligilactobacillus salivarius TaxID=1624 RepID=UPI0019D60E2F